MRRRTGEEGGDSYRKDCFKVLRMTGSHAGTHGAMVPLSDTLTLFFNDLRVKLRFFEDPLNTLIVLPGHGNHMGHHYKYTHAGKCERVAAPSPWR